MTLRNQYTTRRQVWKPSAHLGNGQTPQGCLEVWGSRGVPPAVERAKRPLWADQRGQHLALAFSGSISERFVVHWFCAGRWLLEPPLLLSLEPPASVAHRGLSSFWAVWFTGAAASKAFCPHFQTDFSAVWGHLLHPSAHLWVFVIPISLYWGDYSRTSRGAPVPRTGG